MNTESFLSYSYPKGSMWKNCHILSKHTRNIDCLVLYVLNFLPPYPAVIFVCPSLEVHFELASIPFTDDLCWVPVGKNKILGMGFSQGFFLETYNKGLKLNDII